MQALIICQILQFIYHYISKENTACIIGFKEKRHKKLNFKSRYRLLKNADFNLNLIN